MFITLLHTFSIKYICLYFHFPYNILHTREFVHTLSILNTTNKGETESDSRCGMVKVTQGMRTITYLYIHIYICRYLCIYVHKFAYPCTFIHLKQFQMIQK